jgi:hypothetical protein
MQEEEIAFKAIIGAGKGRGVDEEAAIKGTVQQDCTNAGGFPRNKATDLRPLENGFRF